MPSTHQTEIVPRSAVEIPALKWSPDSSGADPRGFVVELEGDHLHGNRPLHLVRADGPVGINPSDAQMGAFILSGRERRVLDRLADCLVVALNISGHPSARIDVFSTGTSSADAVAVVLVDWEHAMAAQTILVSALAYDPKIERILALSDKLEIRRQHDATTLATFERGGTSMWAQLAYPSGRRTNWRFSEFCVVEEVRPLSVSFNVRFRFGELELYLRALSNIEYLLRRRRSSGASLMTVRASLERGTRRTGSQIGTRGEPLDTDLMFREPVISLRARRSCGQARLLVVELIAGLAHVDGGELDACRPGRVSRHRHPFAQVEVMASGSA